MTFTPGDYVKPVLIIPYKRPGFEGHVCRVTEVDDRYVWASTTKWSRVPAWPFKARELELVE